MAWTILFAVLVVVLMVIYGRLRDERSMNRSKQIKALKEQIREQSRMAKKKDSEFLRNADIDNVVGFLNRMRKDD